jgi:ABC-type iron transport system FetAB permease component
MCAYMFASMVMYIFAYIFCVYLCVYYLTNLVYMVAYMWAYNFMYILAATTRQNFYFVYNEFWCDVLWTFAEQISRQNSRQTRQYLVVIMVLINSQDTCKLRTKVWRWWKYCWVNNDWPLNSKRMSWQTNGWTFRHP